MYGGMLASGVHANCRHWYHNACKEF